MQIVLKLVKLVIVEKEEGNMFKLTMIEKGSIEKGKKEE